MTIGEVLDDACWWAALRLAERRSGRPHDEGLTRARGRRRLTEWCTERRLTGGLPVDLSRWYDDGLAEDDLVLLLGESPTALRRRLPERPAWLEMICQAWSPNALGTPPTSPRPGVAAVAREHRTASVPSLVSPAYEWFARRLRDDVARMTRADGVSWTPAEHPLLAPPTEALLAMVTPLRALSPGQDGDGSAAFRLAESERALGVLAGHPVLARDLVEALETWRLVRAEFAHRLIHDLPLLRAGFHVRARGLAEVVAIRFGVETYPGGRQAALVTFQDGARVVYRPRPLSNEEHFADLVQWLNDQGLAHPLRTVRCLDRGDYGWMEFAAAATCDDEPQRARFYWRQGAYLALLHILRTSDLDSGSLVAASDHPIFVAAMASVRPTGVVPDILPALPVETEGSPAESLLSDGLLPWSGGEDLTAVHGQPTEVVRYQEAFLAGFESCYRILARARSELLAPAGPIEAFGSDEVSMLLRPAVVYQRLLIAARQPDALRDALDRACLFEVLAGGHHTLPHAVRQRLVDSECRRLSHREIPLFHTTRDSTGLFDDRGVVAEGYLARSNLDVIRERIRALSDSDLQRQRCYVAAALASLERAGQGGGIVAEGTLRDLPGSEIGVPLVVDPAGRIAEWQPKTA